VFEPVAPFSGGEKARLALALVVYQRPNLLLLDEPTNHLDLDMRQALEVALQDFAGAVVLVSHDRHLLRVTCDTLWLVAGGRVTDFDGDLDDYARWLAQRDQAAPDGVPRTQPTARDRRRAAAGQRQRAKPLRDALNRLDRRLQHLHSELAELEQQLGDDRLYGSEQADSLNRLLARQATLQIELRTVEQQWLEAAEALEQNAD
jgi:ATP-binding cassette, subfamily F, member 3